MAKLEILAGTTSKLVQVFIQDSSSTIGAGLTGLVFNSGSLTAYYYREGAASAVAITLATMTLGTWATGGFVVVDGTNMPGCYQLAIPDAAVAAGAKSVLIMLKGAANMAPTLLEIELTAINNQDAVRYGLTAIPNVAIGGGAGALPTLADTVNKPTKNTALAAFPFLMVLSSDHVTPATGLTVTATRSIDGAAFGACANAVVEVASGWYKIDLAAADMNGNTIALKFTAATADARNVTIVPQPA